MLSFEQQLFFLQLFVLLAQYLSLFLQLLNLRRGRPVSTPLLLSSLLLLEPLLSLARTLPPGGAARVAGHLGLDLIAHSRLLINATVRNLLTLTRYSVRRVYVLHLVPWVRRLSELVRRGRRLPTARLAPQRSVLGLIGRVVWRDVFVLVRTQDAYSLLGWLGNHFFMPQITVVRLCSRDGIGISDVLVVSSILERLFSLCLQSVDGGMCHNVPELNDSIL